MANLTSFFVDRHLADGRGGRTALLHPGGRTSYAELAALTNRVGNVLAGLGVGRGQKVLLALSDGVEFVATWYAAQKLGAVTAEAYTFLQPKDYAYFLDYTEAVVVVVDAVTLEAVRATGTTATVLVVGVPESELRAGERAFEALVDAAPAELAAAEVADDDVAIWKFTTGSTGRPKACVHPARSAVASFEAYARGVLDLQADDVVLAVPKLFFGYARDLVAMFPFGVGAAGIVYPQRCTPELMFELIREHRPTVLVNVPTMMSAMVAAEGAAGADLSSLRFCTSAGEALPAELHRKWDRAFGVPVVDGIGSSEAYHIYLSNRPGQARHGTVGTPVPGYTARVVDVHGAEVADGEIGTLEVTGPTIAREYHGDPEKSAATFHGDTLLTGDLFARTADGSYQHHGRADDLLKVGGIWVSPAEIEDCLLGHRDVVECAVIGHESDGLVRARAYIVPRGGATTDAEQLRNFARERLAGHKVPREVVFADQLPRTPNGKLDRRALREQDRAS